MLAVPAGPGTEASASLDEHHIIDGELFTVFSDSRGTFVGKGASRLVHWTECERVCGLLMQGGELYSLGLTQGGALVFRCNGVELFRRQDAIPLGGFGVQTYGPGGALYLDCGKVCFAFREKGSVCFVCDGEVSAAVGRKEWNVLDAKIIDSRQLVLYNFYGASFLRAGDSMYNFTQKLYIFWKDAGIIKLSGEAAVAGLCDDMTWHTSYHAVFADGRLTRIHGSPAFLYFDGTSCLPLDLGALGVQDCLFLSGSCACAADGSVAVALTPRSGAGKPFTIFRGKRTEYPVNGFISGIQITY